MSHHHPCLTTHAMCCFQNPEATAEVDPREVQAAYLHAVKALMSMSSAVKDGPLPAHAISFTPDVCDDVCGVFGQWWASVPTLQSLSSLDSLGNTHCFTCFCCATSRVTCDVM